VVDTPQTAEYCTEYLKEKGLFKELLVLQNVPERQIDARVAKDIKGLGHLVYDVIEISRTHVNLERAIRYFLFDKVVCDDFDTAVKVQALGVRDIVTLDGTEFK
jgi:chromosome segregation ATPase